MERSGFCGFGEPTSKLDVLLEVTKWVRANFPDVPIRLDTNGQAYTLNGNRDVAKELKAAGINKVSVSLNGHNQEIYNENCKPMFIGAFRLFWSSLE